MATREMVVNYGALSIGGISTDFLLDNWTRHSVTDGKAESSIEFDCVVTSSSAAGLAALCQSLEVGFRTPREPLSVVLSGFTLLRAGHADAEGGFNTEPSIRKIGDIGDSGRSRRYTLRVAYETPADTASTSGLRESTVNVSYDEARIRTIRVAGVFTAVPNTTSARARYEAAIAAHAASVLSGLSVTTSELIGEPVTEQDYDDKTLRFERIYLELIFGQGQDSPNNNTNIVNQTLSISKREVSEERSATAAVSSGGGVAGGGVASAPGSVQALAIFDLHYEATVDAEVSTDPKAVYDSIRTWLVGQFNAVFSLGTFALTTEKVEVQRARNRFVVDMTAEGAVRGQSLVSRTATSESRSTEPPVFRGLWTGNPDDFFVYQGFRVALQITTVNARYLNTQDIDQAKASTEEYATTFGGAPSGGRDGIAIQIASSATPRRIGIEGSGHTLDMVDVTSVVTSRVVNSVSGGGGAQSINYTVRGDVKFVAPAPVSTGGSGSGSGGVVQDG